MIEKRKLSLPSLIQNVEKKPIPISQYKQELPSPKQQFTHSSKFLKTLQAVSSKKEDLLQSKPQMITEINGSQINNIISQTERVSLEKDNGIKIIETSIKRGMPQCIQIISSQATINNTIGNQNKDDIQMNFYTPSHISKVGVRNKYQSQSVNPTYFLQQSTLQSPKSKNFKLSSSISITEESKQKLLQQPMHSEKLNVQIKSTQPEQQSFDHINNDQFTIQAQTLKDQGQSFKLTKEYLDEDTKYSGQQSSSCQPSSSSKQHHLSQQQLSLERLMKSPIVSQSNIELKKILKNNQHNNSIHLAMKSFSLNNQKSLHQFEKELSKIKENLMNKTYFSFSSKAFKQKFINDSILPIQNYNPLNNQEEEKSQTNQSYLQSPTASASQTLRIPSPNSHDQESRLNQTIIKFITDKTILQEDFIKEIINSEYYEDQKNPLLTYLKKKQMHFTQNPEIIDILEQIDIHHKTFNSSGGEISKDHQAFFKCASMDTIKKDLLSYQNQETQKVDYKLSYEREESKYLQAWLNNMIEKIIKKTDQTFQQTFSELELVFHGCIQELTRQITNGCQERGEILAQIWNQYNYLISRLFSMHRVMIDKQTNDDFCRVKYLTELLEQKQKEFSTSMQTIYSKLEKEEETNKKLNEQNVYIRKKLNKIEKDKLDFQSDTVCLQQDYDELQVQHQHLLNQFQELEKQMTQYVFMPSSSTHQIQFIPGTKQNIQEYEQQGQSSIVEIQNYQDKCIQKEAILQQNIREGVDEKDQKFQMVNSQQKEKQQSMHQINKSKESFKSIMSMENDIFVKNQEQKSIINIEAIQDKEVNTDFRFFIDRVDQSVNTETTQQNLIYFEQETQTDSCELGDINNYNDINQTKGKQRENDIMNEVEYQEILTQLNNHLLSLGSTHKGKNNPEIYYKRLKDMKQDLLNTFKKKKISMSDIKNKAITIQDQQQSILRDILQKLIDSNSNVLDQKMILAEKELKISGLEEQITQQQLKIDILKHNFIENQLSDQHQNEELQNINLEIPDEQTDIFEGLNFASDKQQMNKSIKNGKNKQTLSINKLQSNAKIPMQSSKYFKSKTNTSNRNNNSQYENESNTQIESFVPIEITSKVPSIDMRQNESQDEENMRSLNDALSPAYQFQIESSPTINKSKISIDISNFQIKKSAGGGYKSKGKAISKKNSVLSFSSQVSQDNMLKKKNSIQSAYDGQTNSPKSINTLQYQQSSSFRQKQPQVQISMKNLKELKSRKDSEIYSSPNKSPFKNKSKLQKPTTFFNKVQQMADKSRNSYLAYKEAAGLILETAKVAIISETDFKQVNQILKIINCIYNESFKQYKKGDSDGSQPMIYVLYHWFLNRFGVKNIAEKKLLDFLVQIRKSDLNPKIQVFGKIIGLYKNENLSHYDLQFFTKCMALLEEYCNKGKNVQQIQLEKLKINKTQIYDAVKLLFGRIISYDGIDLFIQNLVDEIIYEQENYNKKASLNNQQIVTEQPPTTEFDIDIVSEKILVLHLQLQEIYMKKFRGLFQIVQPTNFMVQEEFLILTRNIQGKEVKELDLASLFNGKSDEYTDFQFKMSIKRFCILCQENMILGEKDQSEYLKHYQQNNNNSLIENRIHSIKEIWTNWDLVITIIKTRLIYSKSYKRVYQFMIDQIETYLQNTFSMTNNTLEEQYIKNDHIMLIYRILCDESRRMVLEYETNQVIGEEFSHFSSTIKEVLFKIV